MRLTKSSPIHFPSRLIRSTTLPPFLLHPYVGHGQGAAGAPHADVSHGEVHVVLPALAPPFLKPVYHVPRAVHAVVLLQVFDSDLRTYMHMLLREVLQGGPTELNSGNLIILYAV